MNHYAQLAESVEEAVCISKKENPIECSRYDTKQLIVRL